MYSGQSIHRYAFFLIVLLFLFWQTTVSQEQKDGGRKSWLIMQAVPSLSWISFPNEKHFAFEWEFAPVLYSYGMNKLDRRLHFFSVTQPERFAGSIELNLSFQFYTTKYRSERFGFSGQILSHIPLVEKGEHLGLNLGIARYFIAGTNSNYIICGFSTLFGFLHYDVKYCPGEKILMHSIEIRFF